MHNKADDITPMYLTLPLTILAGALLAGAGLGLARQRGMYGMWSSGYWWSAHDRRCGPGC